MDEINLPVIYKSQWDKDADLTKNDCGPASAAMILNYYGENLTTNKMSELSKAGTGLVSISQLMAGIEASGYRCQYAPNLTPDHIKGYLKLNIPVIALVHYGSLGDSRQDKPFTGGHFFVVVGVRADGSYYVNDPNFKDSFRNNGDHHIYSKAEFEKAWSDCSLDKNPVNSLIIIHPKPTEVPLVGTIAVGVVKQAGDGSRLNVRSKPTLDAPVTKVLNAGDKIQLEGQLEGDAVINNNIWYKLTHEEAYVWSGRIEIEDAPTPPPAPELIEENMVVSATWARAASVLSDAMPTLKTKDGKAFGNEEGLARELVAEWPKYLELIVAEKKQRSILDNIIHFLGLS